MAVTIPVKTTYDGKAFQQAERDARRAQQAAIASTRAQLVEHRKVAQLTAKLDRDLAKPKASLKDQMASAFGGQLVAANALQSIISFEKDFLVNSLQAAAAAERLGKATDTLGARFGTTGAEITEAIQQASGYTINQMAAMQSANQAMLLGVAKSPQEFERLTKVAVALGRAMGQDATKSIEDLTVGIGRQSRLILDNLGLMVSTEVAYSKYAASVGKSVDQLTEAEKKQAFLNETLAQGEAKIAGMGEGTLDAAGKVERLTARWADFQIEFGKAISAMGEGTGALDTLNAGVDAAISGSKGWQKAADNAQLLGKGLDKLNEGTWLGDLEQVPIIGNQIKGLDFWGSLIVRTEDLQVAMTDTGAAIEATNKQQTAAAAASQAATAAIEQEAAALEHLGKVNEARKDIAGKLIEIDQKATEDSASAWEDYFKAEGDAWKDHSKNIDKINADSAKEQVEIQKKLAKDLTKVDKDLTKAIAKEDKSLAADLAKIKRDSARDISRKQQDIAKQEKQDRRQRQIDAKGDERLFQFDMRQLAAEGEFNAILAAKERRAIELQIAAEKDTTQQAAEDENNRVEIDRMRQDAADQLAERQAQAEERKQELRDQAEERRQELIDQAAEDEMARQEALAETLANEEASYQERLEALRAAREEKLAAIEEEKQLSTQKLAEELSSNKELTRAEMEAMIPMAQELGINIGSAFAEGINRGFAEQQRVSDLAAGAMNGSSGQTHINPAHPTTSTNIGQKPGKKAFNKPGSSIYGFASGGAFTVGGMGGTDSQLVQFLATPGEKVTVQPPGGGPAINIYASGGVREISGDFAAQGGRRN